MTRSALSFAPALHRVLVRGVDEDIIHHRSVGAQATPTLCGWEGGTAAGISKGDVGCRECLAIVAWFDAARKRRVAP